MQIFAFLFGLIAVAALARFLAKEGRKSLRDGLSGTQTILTLAALLLGSIWYFSKRPDAPRVEVGLSAQVYPLDGKDRALIRVAFTIRNNGQSVMLLGKQDLLTFRMFQVTPFEPSAIEKQLSAEPGTKRDASPPIFALLREERIPMDNMLETGEPEYRPYYAIVDCENTDLALISASLPKPLQGYEAFMARLGLSAPHAAATPQFWHAETLVDLGSACRPDEGRALK